uniref:Uncharacterized protein n=1 Tax=Alexandrium monilatum TaxID=311494 RepID=A0A7S4SIZ7_9DINO
MKSCSEDEESPASSAAYGRSNISWGGGVWGRETAAWTCSSSSSALSPSRAAVASAGSGSSTAGTRGEAAVVLRGCWAPRPAGELAAMGWCTTSTDSCPSASRDGTSAAGAGALIGEGAFLAGSTAGPPAGFGSAWG